MEFVGTMKENWYFDLIYRIAGKQVPISMERA